MGGVGKQDGIQQLLIRKSILFIWQRSWWIYENWNMKIWDIIFDGLWFILLIVVLCHFMRQIIILRRARSWKETSGQIIKCEWMTCGNILWPKFEYKYIVDEQVYMGDAFFLDVNFYSSSSRHGTRVAYQSVLAYNNDAPIKVYYDPKSPGQAVLDTSVSPKLYISSAFIITLIILHTSFVLLRF